MHDVTTEHWHEPKGFKNAGYGAWKRPNTPYDDFMESQGIPIYRGIGVKRVQDMPMKPWARMGGKGTFIQLFGTEGKWGCYVVEVPPRGALNAERHMYEEIMVVVEGRGAREPVASNNDNTGRAKNRRVEIYVAEPAPRT